MKGSVCIQASAIGLLRELDRIRAEKWRVDCIQRDGADMSEAQLLHDAGKECGRV